VCYFKMVLLVKYLGETSPLTIKPIIIIILYICLHILYYSYLYVYKCMSRKRKIICILYFFLVLIISLPPSSLLSCRYTNINKNKTRDYNDQY
jgi:hypothetical protein